MSTNENPLVLLTGQWNEVVKRIGNGSLPTGAVKTALQDIIEGRFVQPTYPFQPLLSSLAEQKQLLVEAGVPEAAFLVDLTEPEEQRVDAYTILFYVPDGAYAQGDPASTMEFYRQMLGKGLEVAPPSFSGARLLHKSCEHYAPGVHRVAVNLLASWNPAAATSTYYVLTQDGAPLAGAEAFAAYALSSPELIKLQGSTMLPGCSTGIILRVDGCLRTFCFGWSARKGMVYLDWHPFETTGIIRSLPELCVGS